MSNLQNIITGCSTSEFQPLTLKIQSNFMSSLVFMLLAQ